MLQNSHLGPYSVYPNNLMMFNFPHFVHVHFQHTCAVIALWEPENMNLNSSTIDKLGKWCLKEVGGAMRQSRQVQRLSMTTLRMATTVTLTEQ